MIESTTLKNEHKKIPPKTSIFNCIRPMSPETDLNEVTEMEEDLLAIYGYNKSSSKRIKLDESESTKPEKNFTNLSSSHQEVESPNVAKLNRNPFIKIESPTATVTNVACCSSSPTKQLDKHNTSLVRNTSPVKRIESPIKRLPKLSKFNRTTVLNTEPMVVSKFFQRNLQTDFKKTENSEDVVDQSIIDEIDDGERNYKNSIELSSKLYIINSDSDDETVAIEHFSPTKVKSDETVNNNIDLTKFSFKKCDKIIDSSSERAEMKSIDVKADKPLKLNVAAKTSVMVSS